MSADDAAIHFRLLGPFEASRDGQPLPLGGAKQRAVLARLLLSANEVVSRDRLVDDLWGEQAPKDAAHTIQVFVSRLRKALGRDVIATRAPGYLVRADEEALDVTRFATLRARGREALKQGRALAAERALAEALSLFRGPPLADFAYEKWAEQEAARLEEARIACQEDLIEATLALGRHGEVVGELEALVAAHPLRERLRGQLMLALYRQGRQAEALECYQQTRALLDEELGIEPSSELRELQRRILNQDPALVLEALPRPARAKLPSPATSFLGRERELDEVKALLARSDVRLLTLTGPGGTGKTRLALRAASELAAEYEDGVYWVPLASLRDPELVLPSAAQALEATQELGDYIGDKDLLLLLDNFEHVVEAAPSLAELLAACPRLELLVTSRESLRLSGEQAYPVPPLNTRDAVELFVTRARAYEPGFQANGALAELCARLDNLPLAIELAAARTKALSPAQILERLAKRLDLLKGARDADPRQQTLRATIEWSYDLLSPTERELLSRLSVFAGGCTLEAAEEVCGADLDTLESLVDKSLLRYSDGRFSMLETIREYAVERLAAAGERDDLRDRHLEWMVGVASAQGDLARKYDPRAFAVLAAEQANAREALAWALATRAADPAQRIFLGSWFYWLTHGVAAEGDEWASRVAAMPSEPNERYGWLLTAVGEFPRFRGDPKRALSFKERSIAVLEELERSRDVDSKLAAALSDASDVLCHLGDLERAQEYAERGLLLRREVGRLAGVAHALEALGAVLERRQLPSDALPLFEEAVELNEAAGQPLEATFPLIGVSRARLALGDLAAARAAAEEARRRAAESSDLHARVHALAQLGLVSNAEGDVEAAVRLIVQAQAESKDGGIVLEVERQVAEVQETCRSKLPARQYDAAVAAGAEAADSSPLLD